MIGLRLVVLACVAGMLLELVIVITKKEHVPSQLLVLVDDSESMGLPGSLRRPGTWPIGRPRPSAPPKMRSRPISCALKRGHNWPSAPSADCWGRWPTSGRWCSIDFPAAWNRWRPTSSTSLRATGTTSAIGDALSTALAAHRGQPLAGVLLVSDGQSNTGQDARKAAEQAGRDGVLVNTLAIGTEQGPSNARLVEIEGSPVVFVRDPSELSVLYESRGLEGQPGSVVLEMQHDGGPWSELGRDEIVFGTDTVIGRASFRFTPEAIGQYQFRATVSQTGPELTDSDNVAMKGVKVVRQRVRALLVAGYPAPEVQFLRNALLRDTALEFASWLQSASEGYEQSGHRPLRRLPANLQELSHYDVVMSVRSRHEGARLGLVGDAAQFCRRGWRRADLCRRRTELAATAVGRQRRRRGGRPLLAARAAGRLRSGAVSIECRRAAQLARNVESGTDARGRKRHDLPLCRRAEPQPRDSGQSAGHVSGTAP